MTVPPTNPLNYKRALRRRLRAARDAFVADAPKKIEAPSAFLALLARGAIVASYRPLGSEADPARLVVTALTAGCRLALPHVESHDSPLRFLAWQPGDALHQGPFGLEQPEVNNPAVCPDIVLTPLLGYDVHLNRLGQGAGHYDRAFAAFPGARRIGVAFSVQQVDALPADAWDVPLDAVITEQGWIT